MIFFDTCVWIELLSVRTPVKPHEIRQARAASALLSNVLAAEETIVTCEEQMLELISAIEKVTMRTVNRMRKNHQQPGIGDLKEFRRAPEFQQTKELCISVIDDVRHFAKLVDIGEYDIDFILCKLEVADINDFLYHDYCIEQNIELYTFDFDMIEIGNSEVLHWFNKDTGLWD